MNALIKNNEICLSESFRVSDLERLSDLMCQHAQSEKQKLLKIKIEKNCKISPLSLLCLKQTYPELLIYSEETPSEKFQKSSITTATIHVQSIFTEIGKNAYSFCHEIKYIIRFISQAFKEIYYILLTPKIFRLRETITQIDQCGFFAIGIVCLVTYLIGIVIAYLMGNQLQYYGANIFVVDGVVVSMCRELSPILVAIVVAGRSGSAFAAQLGSMKLNQETDALEAMGLRTFQVLVIPRIIGLMISLPFLVILGDIFGIFGGMCISRLHLDISFEHFIERLFVVLKPRQVAVGLIKAPIFALFIAAIGCKLGLEAEANSVSIGNNTTKTVVQSIVSVILLNAAAAVLFTNLGI